MEGEGECDWKKASQVTVIYAAPTGVLLPATRVSKVPLSASVRITPALILNRRFAHLTESVCLRLEPRYALLTSSPSNFKPKF